MGRFEGQAFTHDADFALRNCHAAVELSSIGSRRFVSGYALHSVKNGLAVQPLSERQTQSVQILSSGVGRLTEPFYVHGAHSYFCAQGGTRSLFGTMNHGAGSVLRALSTPGALTALIAPSAKTAPVDPATSEATPISSLAIGSFGADVPTLANAG